MASATGASSRHVRPRGAVQAMNAAEATATNQAASRFDMTPRGSSRAAVRGLRASCEASTSRLNPMAADRAVTMQAMIQPSRGHEKATSRVASSAPVSAKGSANTEWLTRTNDA
jgi:hypothetical protein